jgi:hypothetical protein
LIFRDMPGYTAGMGKLLVDVDREALERVRVKLGARSGAEALRKLIALHDGVDALSWPSGPELRVGDTYTFAGESPRRITADTSGAKVTGPGRPKVPYGSLLKKR